jgi:RHS repeat-associated protein
LRFNVNPEFDLDGQQKSAKGKDPQQPDRDFEACASLSERKSEERIPRRSGNCNIITNGVWSFRWDAEKRMVAAYSNDELLVVNIYDDQSRRIRKVTGQGTRTFLYDGWNPIREIVSSGQSPVTNYYCWGTDLSGTLEGVGGVGGLLAVMVDGATPATYYPCYDANGNITAYVDESGIVRAEYAYDAFGQTISPGGDLASVFSYRFSTKYADDETGLYYYGYRFYSPGLGRWVNRDPLGEQGGMNLFLACYNNFLTLLDNVGLEASFYTKGRHETLFHLAADEQAFEIKINTVEEALKLKNNSDNWGPIFRGSKPVKEFTLDELLNEWGEVDVYAHGVIRGTGFNERGGFPNSLVDAIRLSEKLAKRPCWHNLTKVKLYVCRMGSRGGAQKFANILNVPVRTKTEGDVDYDVVSYVDFTSSRNRLWYALENKNILEEFVSLAVDLHKQVGAPSYDKFRTDWKALTDKYIKKGCIKGAYWHVEALKNDFSDFWPN